MNNKAKVCFLGNSIRDVLIHHHASSDSPFFEQTSERREARFFAYAAWNSFRDTNACFFASQACKCYRRVACSDAVVALEVFWNIATTPIIIENAWYRAVFQLYCEPRALLYAVDHVRAILRHCITPTRESDHCKCHHKAQRVETWNIM